MTTKRRRGFTEPSDVYHVETDGETDGETVEADSGRGERCEEEDEGKDETLAPERLVKVLRLNQPQMRKRQRNTPKFSPLK